MFIWDPKHVAIMKSASMYERGMTISSMKLCQWDKSWCYHVDKLTSFLVHFSIWTPASALASERIFFLVKCLVASAKCRY